MKGNVIAVVAAGLMLSGCVDQQVKEQQQKDFDRTIPTCGNPDECEVKWGAALKWVQQHSAFRVQTYTDTFIQTFKSGDASNTGMGAEVTKEPLGKGQYRIVVNPFVNNVFLQGTTLPSAIDFNNFVNAAYVPG